jgi:hypothetical protein
MPRLLLEALIYKDYYRDETFQNDEPVVADMHTVELARDWVWDCQMLGLNRAAESLKRNFWNSIIITNTNLESFEYQGEILDRKTPVRFFDWLLKSRSLKPRGGWLYVTHDGMEKEFYEEEGRLVKLTNVALQLSTKLDYMDSTWNLLLSTAIDGNDRDLGGLTICLKNRWERPDDLCYCTESFQALHFVVGFTLNPHEILARLRQGHDEWVAENPIEILTADDMDM